MKMKIVLGARTAQCHQNDVIKLCYIDRKDLAGEIISTEVKIPRGKGYTHRCKVV